MTVTRFPIASVVKVFHLPVASVTVSWLLWLVWRVTLTRWGAVTVKVRPELA